MGDIVASLRQCASFVLIVSDEMHDSYWVCLEALIAAKADVDKPANPTVVEFYVKYVRRELHSIDEEDREKVRGVMIAATFLRASVN